MVACIMATELPATRKRSLAPFRFPEENPLPGNYDSSIDDRQYPNEDLINLRDWLNDAFGTAAYDRVVSLIAEIRKLQSDYDSAPRGHSSPVLSKSELKSMLVFRDRLSEVQARLSRYTFSLRAADELSVHRRRLRISLRPDPLPDDFVPSTKLSKISDNESLITNPGTFRMGEGRAVLCFARLFTSGDSHRLKLCEKCRQRWIAATKSHYRFCSDKCREDTYAASDEYSKRKREQMRRQRREEGIRAARGISVK
jgi:hypothetical protein